MAKKNKTDQKIEEWIQADQILIKLFCLQSYQSFSPLKKRIYREMVISAFQIYEQEGNIGLQRYLDQMECFIQMGHDPSLRLYPHYRKELIRILRFFLK
ncbi:hypothetical protein [Listeria fleischmannii]|uniref:Uncharacterized protein n=1 Tax=Listeria fleischmannii TaxID=1069827 RepID=A0A841YIY6_9LIST|nr:hypothetical protein [Listeria fleischmannii]MBC1399917.1 hypothetical protein [Listeria fleischmannii]